MIYSTVRHWELTWVVVLEVVKSVAAGGADLVTDCLSSGARTGGNNVAVTWLGVDGGEGGVVGWLVGPSGRLRSRLGEGREGQATGTGKGVGRSLKLSLSWEEEDDGAGLAGV